MAEFILVNGASGSGKSHAALSLNPEKSIVICPENKILPFGGAMAKYKTIIDQNGNVDLAKSNFYPINKVNQPNNNKRASDPGIYEALQFIDEERPEIKVALIDTFTYAMVESVMREINVDNYKKFNVFAQEFYELVKLIPRLRKDLFVIMTSHIEEDQDFSGVRRTSFKIPAGKLTKQTIVPEGLFTVVLFAESTMIDGKPVHFFSTVNSGTNTCKAPDGMFPAARIPNDYRFVMDCYYAFYLGKEQPKLPATFQLNQQNTNS